MLLCDALRNALEMGYSVTFTPSLELKDLPDIVHKQYRETLINLTIPDNFPETSLEDIVICHMGDAYPNGFCLPEMEESFSKGVKLAMERIGKKMITFRMRNGESK